MAANPGSGTSPSFWPATAEELIELQHRLAAAAPDVWHPPAWPKIGGCFVCFARGEPVTGRAGDDGWAGAALVERNRVIALAAVPGRASAGYAPGLLALREGELLEAAVRALPDGPDALMVNATGRDHPRGAGLALHLGAALHVPSIGVTNRPLIAEGAWPADEAGARTPLMAGSERVGYWVRTRRGTHPLAVHAAWRTDPDTAVELVLASGLHARTPEPLRAARRAAREARARHLLEPSVFRWFNDDRT
jgi:deoxyribonuclease V